jgi:endo-1,4-beta-D-glucanase Y/4-amino-4-deoxy-L-arabinose transferase-like glycosyltransferase
MNVSLSSGYSLTRSVSTVGAQLGQLLVLFVGIVAHAYNMFGYPLFLGDEGIYMSQAWAVLTQGRLTPYTYWYDHAPAGWLLIAVWTALTGGFSTFGTAVDSGRALMLLLHAVSLLLLYRITLRLSGSVLASIAASLVFALSPLAIVYGRQVLLDNVMTFWLLLAVAWLQRHEGHLWPLLGSAACFAVAVLSKESAAAAIVAFVFALYTLVQHYHRRFARTGWLFVAISIISLYPLFAALKDELINLSFSSPLNGNADEVTLVGALLWQLGRSGGMPWDPTSDFYQMLTTRWLPRDAFVLALGILSALWVTLRGPNDRRVLGLMALASAAAIARGAPVLEFYIVAALPWLAICIGLLISDLAGGLRLRGTVLALSVACVALAGYNLYGQREIFTLKLTEGQRQALAWVQNHVPPGSRLIIDDDIWVDLRRGSAEAPAYPDAHSHWKAALDPAIWIDFFDDNWRNVDYLVLTPGLKELWQQNPDRFPWAVYQQSTLVASFGEGEAQVEVRRVNYPGYGVASAIEQSYEGFKEQFLREGKVGASADGALDARHQASALLMAVWMDDQESFAQIWETTKARLQDERGLLAGENRQGFTEADTDAATALLMAQNRWGTLSYGLEARRIVRGIRDHYVVEVAGKPVLTVGDRMRSNDQVVFAPAAFAPAAYHLFAYADPGYNWWYLLDTNYALLANVTSDPLGGERSAGLPPAYVGIDRATGAYIANPKGAPRGSNTFDAYAAQVYWRIALDARLHDDGRADSYLKASEFLSDEWRRKGELFARYSHDGKPAAQSESLALYSAVLPKLNAQDQSLADALFAAKLVPQYNQDRDHATWGGGANVDEHRMAWLATGLYGRVINDDWSNRALRADQLLPRPEKMRSIPR